MFVSLIISLWSLSAAKTSFLWVVSSQLQGINTTLVESVRKCRYLKTTSTTTWLNSYCTRNVQIVWFSCIKIYEYLLKVKEAVHWHQSQNNKGFMPERLYWRRQEKVRHAAVFRTALEAFRSFKHAGEVVILQFCF